MNVEDSAGWKSPNATNRHFVRSVLILTGSILAAAAPLCLFSIIAEQSGTGGPWGVAAAALICLIAGVAADMIGSALHRALSSHAALLAGMAVRSVPPLAVCLLLAANGGGREHLAFVVYLLTFYLVILTIDTWWAVRRVANSAP